MNKIPVSPSITYVAIIVYMIAKPLSLFNLKALLVIKNIECVNKVFVYSHSLLVTALIFKTRTKY